MAKNWTKKNWREFKVNQQPELTGDDVSECIGGATNLKVEDLII